jgi:cell wall assembly regulator SMI1
MSSIKQKLVYDKQLKKVDFDAIQFTKVSLKNIPAPFYEDYSNHPDPAYQNYKEYDKFGFKDLLMQQLSKIVEDTVLKILIITPREKALSYDAFAYLSSKNIVALHFKDADHFIKWMDVIFKKQHQSLIKNKENGLYERQPKLNPNPQFMLTLGKGEFTQCIVNSGMMIDEKPYENTGQYLFKKAPQEYNKGSINKEKENFIKKHINTVGSDLNLLQLSELYKIFLKQENVEIKQSENNENTYEAFKKITGFDLPKELKTLFNIHNGSNGFGFITASQILTEWKGWKEIYDDWTLEDLTDLYEPDNDKTLGMYTNPYWIPFFSTAGGNFIAIDYTPGNQGKSGQIIAFGADEYKIRFIAKNMQDFLQQFIDGKDVLDNGF